MTQAIPVPVTGMTPTSGQFAIASRTVNFFATAGTFAQMSNSLGIFSWLGMYRSVRVKDGLIYVFSDGMVDNLGNNEVYYQGELTYVGANKSDLQRVIYVLTQYGAQFVIAGQRPLIGISTSSADVATAQMNLAFEVVQPKALLARYAGRLDTLNDEIAFLLEQFIQNTISDEVWGNQPELYLRKVMSMINPHVVGHGIEISVAKSALTRSLPHQVNEIIQECRLAEHRLIDVMDGGRFAELIDTTQNAQRIAELRKDPNHSFLDHGDVTAFVNAVTRREAVRGRAFFDMFVHKLRSVNPDLSAIELFVQHYAGACLTEFVKQYGVHMANTTDWEMSLAVLRNHF
jgi:hypothetical protein